MTFNINTLTVKNFMSVGNQTQAVHLDRDDLTLVIGENYDVSGGEGGARNGTGKTTIINALSYGLYGLALTNIKRDNLINKTNSKGMLVTVEFEKNNVCYKIERGRKPNVLKFYIGDHEVEPTDDSSQGDSRETQAEIERLLGMSHNMFKHIVALNTYTEPFLSMRANDQREIIEQLLGITQLSEKAESLKEQIKEIKFNVQEEEYRIKAVQDANSRITDQINSLKRRQSLWQKKHEEDLNEFVVALDELTKIDIDLEIELHRQILDYNEKLAAKKEAQKWIDSLTQDYTKEESLYLKLEKEIQDIEDHRCYACGTKLHDSSQQEILSKKTEQRKSCETHMHALESRAEEYHEIINNIGDLEKPAASFYSTLESATEHRNTVTNLEQQILRKSAEVDPYAEQIEEMEKEAIQEINWNTVNELTRIKDHQEFLLKLLTNKDSFIRKRIIDQNLSYLNTRLDYYLQNIGLPHNVEFKNDLSVEIQELGRDLDFDNLSRGERNRLILSLSWAFRDVWENLYHPINLLFIDELVDSGMDSSGVENAMSVLKHMSRNREKSVWLVSHKEELIGRVNNVLKVIKEGGFTSYSNEIEVA
jgi:DNA repair exonuclease SbcCD ATPase subunit